MKPFILFKKYPNVTWSSDINVYMRRKITLAHDEDRFSFCFSIYRIRGFNELTAMREFIQTAFV